MVVAPSLVSRTMVQSLVSIAEHPKDDFRRVCLDAIRELGKFMLCVMLYELSYGMSLWHVSFVTHDVLHHASSHIL